MNLTAGRVAGVFGLGLLGFLLVTSWIISTSSLHHHDPIEPTKVSLRSVGERVQIWMVKRKRLPNTLDEVYGDQPVPRDGWGNELILEVPGPGGAEYDIVSRARAESAGCSGPDGPDHDIRLTDDY